MARALPSWLRRADDALYAFERAFVVAAATLMVVTVFFEVVNRRLIAPESKLALLLCTLLGLDKTDGGPVWVRSYLAPALGALVAVSLLRFAFSTMRRRGAPLVPEKLELVVAIAGTLALFGYGLVMLHRPANEFYALVWLSVLLGTVLSLVRKKVRGPAFLAAALALPAGTFAIYMVVPDNYNWTKETAMLLLVWVGMVGASMAGHDGKHIDIDFGKKMFPEKLRVPVAVLAQLCTIAFSLFLAQLGYKYVFADDGLFHLDTRFPSTNLPHWLVGIAIPYCFTVIALRTSIVAFKMATSGDLTVKSSGNPPPPSLTDHKAPAKPAGGEAEVAS